MGVALHGESSWSVDTEMEGLTLHVPNNHAIACSGDMHQFVLKDGVRYSHIIDPRNGQAVQNQTLTFVLAPTATAADAWATACSVDPQKNPPKGLRFISTPSELVP